MDGVSEEGFPAEHQNAKQRGDTPVFRQIQYQDDEDTLQLISLSCGDNCTKYEMHQPYGIVKSVDALPEFSKSFSLNLNACWRIVSKENNPWLNSSLGAVFSGKMNERQPTITLSTKIELRKIAIVGNDMNGCRG